MPNTKSEESKELLALKYNDIYKRFLYYTETKHYRYDYTIEILKREFYLSSQRLYQIVKDESKKQPVKYSNKMWGGITEAKNKN